MYFFYYYPIGVDVPRPRVPWMTALLVSVLVAVQLFAGPWSRMLDVRWLDFAYVPAVLDPWTPATAIFLHGGWLHLAGNLLYLIVFGPSIERALGRGGLLLVFVGTGYLGNLVHGAIVMETMPEAAWVPLVGASGAISGLLGLFLMRFPYARLRFAYWAFMPLQGINRTGVSEVPAFVGFLFWVALQVVWYLVLGPASGTAYGAHLGGLATGLLLAVVLGLPRLASIERLRVGARRSLEGGNAHAAVGRLQRYVERAPYDEEGQLELARAMRIAGDRAGATQIYRRAIARALTRRDVGRVCELYAEARRGDPIFHLDAGAQRQVAFWLEKSGDWSSAAQAQLDFALYHGDHPDRVMAMARAATLISTRLDDPVRALEILDQALATAPDHPMSDWIRSERARLRRRARRVAVA